MSQTTDCFPRALCESLREEGLCACVRTVDVWGQDDTRLYVSVPGAPAEVEILGPVDDLPQPPRWQAVRIEGGKRSVWEGPSRQDPDSDLHTFVWELACLERQRLADRWRSIGPEVQATD